MPTLLHISDLHRTSLPRLSNDDLLAAIISDSERWRLEEIPSPELIVVSGDLIQGASLGAPNADTIIEDQYSEAADFLRRLGEEFVASNRSRIVIVPGNHDVHWGRSLDGMRPIESCPAGFAAKAFKADSGLRWDWRDQTAYEIFDPNLYESRFEHFRRFQEEFYEGMEPSPLVQSDGDLLFFEYPDLDLAVAGFASWHGNDCLCHVGEIKPSSLVLSQKLLKNSRMATALAVWHHSISGGPHAQDYMDQRRVHRLIDFGFSIGLHGHQHFPGAAPFELRLPNRTSMAVIGAGSLAVGDDELPMGERRQFNIVVIDPESKRITVHVRGMSPAGVFTGSHRDDFGGHTYITLCLPTAPTRAKRATSAQLLDEAMTAIGAKRYEQALSLIADLPPSRSLERRRIEIEALTGLGSKHRLIKLLNPPKNMDEVVRIISLFLEAGRFDEAQECLLASQSLMTANLFNDLESMIATRRMKE